MSSFFTKPKIIFIATLLIILALTGLAIWQRLDGADQVGNDIDAYRNAIQSMISGENPYIQTIKTFQPGRNPSNHGFAYLPGFLYLFGIIYLFSLKFGWSYVVLWKIPILLADVGTGILIAKYLYPKNKIAAILGVLVWFFNPYSYTRTSYTYVDPFPTFLLLCSLIYLEKDDVLSGTFYALSIIFKTFPIILLPVMLLKSKNKVLFLIITFVVGIAFIVPFLKHSSDFMTVMQGSVLVHAERLVQGRPFLFYLSYYGHISLIQKIPLQIYVILATLLGGVLSIIAYFKFHIKDKYVLTTLTLLNFYLFTPVFNRTYVIWIIPFLIIGSFNLSKSPKYKYLFYIVVPLFWLFFYWYLHQWRDGFDVWHPI